MVRDRRVLDSSRDRLLTLAIPYVQPRNVVYQLSRTTTNGMEHSVDDNWGTEADYTRRADGKTLIADKW